MHCDLLLPYTQTNIGHVTRPDSPMSLRASPAASGGTLAQHKKARAAIKSKSAGQPGKEADMSITNRILSWHPTDADVRELVGAVAVAAVIITVSINACPVGYAIYCILG